MGTVKLAEDDVVGGKGGSVGCSSQSIASLLQ